MRLSKATTTRNRKSERLTPEEFKSFKKYVASFITKQDALDNLEIKKYGTLRSLLQTGQGSPDSIARIRKALETSQAA